MKIVQIELKDLEILIDEETGEYKKFYKNEKKYPVFLTNYSLSIGKDLGLTKSSLIGDILKLDGIDSDDKATREEAHEGLDQTKMTKIIYLGFIGANKSIKLTFDEFIEKFHYSFEDIVEMYFTLVIALMSNDKNNFASGLLKSAKKPKGKK